MKSSRCGILPMVNVYVAFAEQSKKLIAASPSNTRPADLVGAHRELIHSLMKHLNRVASDSVKTPREVVLMGRCAPSRGYLHTVSPWQYRRASLWW